jgi:hypothetical protein
LRIFQIKLKQINFITLQKDEVQRERKGEQTLSSDDEGEQTRQVDQLNLAVIFGVKLSQQIRERARYAIIIAVFFFIRVEKVLD